MAMLYKINWDALYTTNVLLKSTKNVKMATQVKSVSFIMQQILDHFRFQKQLNVLLPGIFLTKEED